MTKYLVHSGVVRALDQTTHYTGPAALFWQPHLDVTVFAPFL